MNQGEHNGFSECGWFVCLSVGIGTQANPVNPVILSKNLYSYDALGEAVVSARDINLDGQIDFAGPDIVTSNATQYVQIGGAWWRESRQYAFPDAGSSEPLLVSTSRQRLSGLGGAYSADGTSGVLVAESVSIDARGNQSTSRTVVDRGTATVYQIAQAPDSTIAALSVTVNGLLQSRRSNHNLTTTYAYDALGRMVSMQDARGGVYSRGYDEYGRVAWESDPATNGTWYAYDALGRQVAVTNALGQATYTAYDAENRVISTWGATYPVAYAYDDFGRMTAMNTFRDEAMQNGDTTTWLYDEPTGLLTNKVYADGKGPRYTYTPDGKLSTRTWARGIATAYAYNAAGQLTGVDYSDTTPDVAYTYDRLGRQKVAQTFLSAHHYAYDPATLALVSETIIDLQAGTSNVISRATDSLGRSTGFSLSPLPLGEGQGEGAAPYSVTYGYDTYGRFAQVSNFQFQVSYSYLPGSSLVSGMTASSGHAWTRSYEPHRDLISAVQNTFGPAIISRFDYVNDEIGRRVSRADSGQAFQNPAFDVYSYNARSEVIGAQRYHGTNPADTSRPFGGRGFGYAFDPIGNRTSATETIGGETLTKTYVANELNQYTSIDNPDAVGLRGSATNTATVTVNGNAAWRLGEYFFGGDDADNASSAIMKELETLAVINPPETNMPDIVQAETGRIFVPETPEAFTHDDDGNLTQDGRFTYTWDGENRLIAVETRADLPASVPRVRVTYQYDPRSRRIGKQSYTWATDHWTLITDNSFTYDGWNLIQELAHTQTHTLTNLYTWGLDLSGSFQGAGGVGGLLAVVSPLPLREGQGEGSTAYLPCYDANGNVCEYTSEDGTLAAHYEYSPFGETVVQSGDMADAFTFRFSTKYWESEAKLNYYGFRYYAPGVGRWLSRDPIGERGGYNLYGFAYNNAYSWIDPLGRRVYVEASPLGPGAEGVRLYHCSLVIEYCDPQSGGIVRETFEIGPNPNIAAQAGEQRGVTRRTRALGIVVGAAGSGSTGSSSGGSTSGSSGGSSSGPIGSSAGSSSGSFAGGSSGSSAGSSSGSSGSSAAATVAPGPTQTQGEPNAGRRTHVYTVDNSYGNDQAYLNAAQSTAFGIYDLFSNNCCHWAARVITASGGSWPVSININAGYNQGNPNAGNTEVPNPRQLPAPQPPQPQTPTNPTP